MKYHKASLVSRSWPRLVIENQTGFLHLSHSSNKIEIGNIEGREFRLVQCLFSPQNFLSAKYNPVAQTYERVSNLMGVTAKVLEQEMFSIVRASMGALQKSEVGLYLAFSSDGDRLRMAVAS